MHWILDLVSSASFTFLLLLASEQALWRRSALGFAVVIWVFVWAWSGTWGRSAPCVLQGEEDFRSPICPLVPVEESISVAVFQKCSSFYKYSINKMSSCSVVRLSELWIAAGNARKWLVLLLITRMCTTDEKVQIASEAAGCALGMDLDLPGVWGLQSAILGQGLNCVS